MPQADFSPSSYDFRLSPELIAQRPAEPRDSSRLLVLDRAKGTWEHRRFTDLPSYLDEHDMLVANNTRVIKARLLGQRVPDPALAGRKSAPQPPGQVEMLLLREEAPLVWEGAFRSSAKAKPGLRFRVPTPDGIGLVGELVRGVAESRAGTVVARFDRDPIAAGAGEVPLPPYIERGQPSSSLDDEAAYQTVYAKHAGSAAAPTAGFHFTERVLEALRRKRVGWEEITLHVGLGTFRPVKSGDIREHVMHEERYEISRDVAERITQAKREGRRIVAVGTTSVRTLESAWSAEHRGLAPGAGSTELFLYPGSGRSFRVVDRMITNFHLPKSTLLMLVCAFAGRELTLAAYAEAIRERYRFYSYGDAMLIL